MSLQEFRQKEVVAFTTKEQVVEYTAGRIALRELLRILGHEKFASYDKISINGRVIMGSTRIEVLEKAYRAYSRVTPGIYAMLEFGSGARGPLMVHGHQAMAWIEDGLMQKSVAQFVADNSDVWFGTL